MKWLIVATAGSGLWLVALPTNASASDSLEQTYKSCRSELRGIGTGKGAPQRRFNMIEFCLSRKLAKLQQRRGHSRPQPRRLAGTPHISAGCFFR